MTAGWCARTTRAAMFAAVCVLLAALGHVMMSGAAVPWWALLAGFAATSGVGWCLAGRERGLPLVVSVVALAQGALHSVFSLTQPSAPGAGTGMTGMPMGSSPMGSLHMGSSHMDAMDMGAMGSMNVLGSTGSMGMGHAGHLGHMAHDMGGGSAFGMFAAHALAALLSGLWLAYGERTAFRLLRAVAAWLAAPLWLPLALLPAPPSRPRPRPSRERTEREPRLLLAHTIISRGPPAGPAVV
ncbi:hypothetical protein [Streptomyces echinatus]|uniref:hypothetical protein n=1 Tax=Streptomyces echinatus TaxID=67293 RepID=UPI003803031A